MEAPIAPSPALRKSILRTFTRKYNLTLQSAALGYIVTVLSQHGLLDRSEDWEESCEALAKGFIESEGPGNSDGAASSVVTRPALERVYAQLVVSDTAASTSSSANATNGAGATEHPHEHGDLTAGERADPHAHFAVVDALKMPRVVFDPRRKVFERAAPGSLLPTASSRPAFLRARHDLLRNVVLRNENFTPPLLFGDPKKPEREGFMKLTSTKNLLGRTGQRFLLFGMLCTAEDGQYALEDGDGRVGLDMEEALPGEGIFTEGAFVLVEGEYTEAERIHVFALGHPPSEPRKVARQSYGHVDFLGTGAISLKDEEALHSHEQSHDELCMVVISDLHLDHARTLSNFRAMLQGYVDAEFVPFAFVLCGNFCSTSWHGSDAVRHYQDAFDQLADLLSAFPSVLRNSHFIFVPGPSDPFASPLLPRPALPEILIAKLRVRLGPRAHFASNPARIQYFGQEIVVYRDDVMGRMLRNSVRLKDEPNEAELKKYLVSTLLDQAHLCPLPQQVRPVLWEHDHALRLYPMPTALVLADKYDRFELTYEGCHVFNPGSFRGSAFGWTTYYPATGRAERSELPNDRY